MLVAWRVRRADAFASKLARWHECSSGDGMPIGIASQCQRASGRIRGGERIPPGFTSSYLQRRAGERSDLGERVASGNPSCRPQGLASVARYSVEERCNREHPVDVLTIVQDGANESYFRENLEEDDDCFL